MALSIVDFAQNELGVKLYPGQAEALTDYYSSGKPNWLFLAGRRGGKSLTSDIVACYEAIVPDFSEDLREGEERYIVVVSTRLDNASLHIQNIQRLLSRKFKRMIVTASRDRLELSNNVTIISLPASARAGRGYTASCLILDELAHFIDSAGNQSADAVYDALSPVLATFGDRGRLIITTTPASKTGITWELYDRREQLDDLHVTVRGTRDLNPKVSERTISRARMRDAETAAVEYDAEFRDPCESYLDSEAIDAAVENYHPPARSAGHTYALAIDPATMGDRYAFIIAHKEGERIILDYSHILKPPVNPETAETLLYDLVERFKPVVVRCDTASTVQRLKERLPQLEYTPFSRPMKLRIYGALKETLNLGNLVLYQDPELIAELRALQIRNGVDISAPRSGKVKHDDLSDCLALCVDYLVANNNETLVLPNLFYAYEGADMGDFAQIGGRWEYIPGRARNAHPAGVTWQNCRNRNRGCEACIAELTAEGHYNQPDRDPDAIHSSTSAEFRENLVRMWQAEELRRLSDNGRSKHEALRDFYAAVNRHKRGE
jgi:hypothetical protein